jgi:ADP-ribosylglycohydrolase
MLQATRFRFEEAAKVAAAKTHQARDARQAAEAAAAAAARLAQAAQAGRLHLEQLEKGRKRAIQGREVQTRQPIAPFHVDIAGSCEKGLQIGLGPLVLGSL